MSQPQPADIRPEIGLSIVAGGIRTNYHEVGEGLPVLLLHGSGPGVTAWANWRFNLPDLARSFRCLAPDLVGFGYTEPPQGPIRDKAVWVRHVIDFLDAKGIDKVSLIGNSFGGAISLALMIAHPDRIERSVLMGPGGIDFEITEALDKVWGYEPSIEAMSMVLHYLASDTSRLTPDLIRSRYEASARPEQHSPYAATFGRQPRQNQVDMLANAEADLRQIPHEVLILHGLLDQVLLADTSLRLTRMIKNSDLHTFGNCGHWVQIERATTFNRMVTHFLRHGLNA